VVTNTFTAPGECAGATTFSCVPDTNVVASDDPVLENFTVAPGTNPDPFTATVFPPAVGPAFGARPVSAGAPNAYRSPLVDALVPPGVVTNTLTVPAACAGATTFNCVPDTNVVASDDPELENLTVAPDTNPDPFTVTVFPPAVGPAFGDRAETVGGAGANDAPSRDVKH
jgi:hypothetical protein